IIAILGSLAAGTIAFFVGRIKAAKEHSIETLAVRQELSQRLGELLGLQELSLMLSDSLELDRIVDEVVGHVRSFVDADGVLLALADEDNGDAMHVASADGSLSDLIGQNITQTDAGLLGQAQTEKHIAVSHIEDGMSCEMIAGSGVRTCAAAPLEAHGTSSGVLAVVRDHQTPFTPEDLRQLSTVATHAAIALQNAKFFDLIRTGKEQWEATFDSLANGIAVIDDENTIRRANRALAEMVSQPITGIIGDDICSTVMGESPELEEHFERERGEMNPEPFCQQTELHDLTLRISASPMPGVGDGWLVVQIEDVTERTAMEAQLIQSEKMAAVGQLVSGVAHDLNNPITAIAGLADFLLSQESTPEHDKDHIEMIHQQSERAAHIVRNLLTFARKDPVETGKADLNDITQRALDLIHHEMKLTEVELEVNLEEDLPVVRGDRYELQRVVLNLLTNAVQALSNNSPEQPRVVSLSTVSRKDSVSLLVTDTGPGIDRELLPQIFLPFVTTKAPGEGTGLGLSIAYRIMQAHEGSIAAESGPGGGTTFTVSLPLREPADEEPVLAKRQQSDSSSVSQQKGSILVVDDPAVQQAIRMLFSKDGHAVDATRDASQALALLADNYYDLIIAEATSTDSMGRQFADALSNDRPDLVAKTIFITADVRKDTEEWLQELDCTFLRKPFDPNELRAAAVKILGS
nr:ATP-binding protein [Myxococcota bacterium]